MVVWRYKNERESRSGRIWNGFSWKKNDLEVQRQDKGVDPHRARYHSSVMDIENLHSGQEFKELPDTYTILSLKKIFMVRAKQFIGLKESTLQRVSLLKMGAYLLCEW